MIFLGIFPLLNELIDKKIIRKDLYYSPLFRRNTLQLLIKHYGGSDGHKIDKATGNLGYGLLHYALINSIKPERVLCIGSQRGFIPAICALACKDNGRGQVDFVDAGKSPEEKGDWGGIGFWRERDLREHFSVLDLNSWITPYIMTTRKFAKQYKTLKWEYIYVDGDHSYEGVKQDFELFWKRLVAGGIMAFHDIDLKGLYHGEEFGVWKFWKEMKHRNKISLGSGGVALGFVQKTSLTK